MSANSASRLAKGFTLVELMITVVIVAVILTIAVPGFLGLIERNRLQAAANNVYSSLVLARSEALKRNRPVVICKSNAAGTACETSDPGEWEGGWLVHADIINLVTPDSDEILAVRESLRNGYTLRVVDDPNDASPADVGSMTYRPNGGASNEAAFILCNGDEDVATARVIVVEVTGRPRIYQSASDCTP